MRGTGTTPQSTVCVFQVLDIPLAWAFSKERVHVLFADPFLPAGNSSYRIVHESDVNSHENLCIFWGMPSARWRRGLQPESISPDVTAPRGSLRKSDRRTRRHRRPSASRRC